MTRRELAETLIEAWQQKLGLSDWVIRLSDRTTEDDYSAQTAMRITFKTAQIRIDHDLPDSLVESDVVHELLHILLKPYTQLANRCAGMAKDGAAQVLLDELDDREELLCNQLARAMTGIPHAFYGAGAEGWETFAA